jgi:GNAT superfamily N-acetyltransferase
MNTKPSKLLQEVMSGGRKNAHCAFGEVALYVRRSTRAGWSDQYVAAFDVATIEVPEELQGQGRGTQFFDWAEAEADRIGVAIYVESILNERLYQFLLRRGYSLSRSDTASLIRLPRT